MLSALSHSMGLLPPYRLYIISMTVVTNVLMLRSWPGFSSKVLFIVNLLSLLPREIKIKRGACQVTITLP